MGGIQPPENPGDEKGNGEHDAQAQGALKDAPQKVAVARTDDAHSTNPPKAQPSNAAKPQDRSGEQKPTERQRRGLGHEWPMVFFSAILTVATIVQAFFIHDANEISRRAAVAAETAAKAARDSVDMAKSGQKSADEALAATRSIAVANQKSAEATERTAAILDKVSNAAAESNQTAKTSADAAQKTANALEKSLEMEKDTAQKSLRAYVYVGASAMTFTPAKDGKGGELETTLTIDNKGVTFAHDVIISSNLICVPTSFKGPFDLNLFGHSTHQDLGPAGNFQLKTKAIIDSVQWKGYTAGTHTAWIFGEITYTDDFKVKHHSHFRFKPTDSLSSTIPRTWLLIYADQGNDSD